jgi:hypothetical protein
LGSWSNTIIRHPLRAVDFVPEAPPDLKFFFVLSAFFHFFSNVFAAIPIRTEVLSLCVNAAGDEESIYRAIA